MRIQLGAADRERYGIAEWIELDPNLLRVDEAEAVERAYGISPTAWLAGLRDDGTGKPQPTLNNAGEPVPLSSLVRCRFWMAAHRAGCRVPLEEFTFNLLECRSDNADEADGGANVGDGGESTGKARSPSRSPRTRSPSRPSGDG